MRNGDPDRIGDEQRALSMRVAAAREGSDQFWAWHELWTGQIVAVMDG